MDALWLAPGGPYARDSTVVAAVDRCLDHDTPFLGTCSGFQYACLVLARRAGVPAVHAEVDPSATDAVIGQLACSLYGEERVVTLTPGTALAAMCRLRGWRNRNRAAASAAGCVRSRCRHAEKGANPMKGKVNLAGEGRTLH